MKAEKLKKISLNWFSNGILRVKMEKYKDKSFGVYARISLESILASVIGKT